MDEIRRLENQIRELQEELQRQNMQAGTKLHGFEVTRVREIEELGAAWWR